MGFSVPSRASGKRLLVFVGASRQGTGSTGPQPPAPSPQLGTRTTWAWTDACMNGPRDGMAPICLFGCFYTTTAAHALIHTHLVSLLNPR